MLGCVCESVSRGFSSSGVGILFFSVVFVVLLYLNLKRLYAMVALFTPLKG
jgi:hypothetical protein